MQKRIKFIPLTLTILVGLLTTLAHAAAPAISVISPVGTSNVKGVLTLTPTENGVLISGVVAGLTPNGIHGFHIHECGDCTAVDASSAGGHYNPTQMPHAGPHHDMHHQGDLGNLVANADGIATVSVISVSAKLDGPYSVMGRALVIHAKPDDLTSQPAGASGPRIGCGVIGYKGK